jgi:glycosyltransferase involved in cell wall biosynthesis
MKILIDGRLYGLENAGIGRYVVNLVDQLARVGGKNSYVLVLREKYFDKLILPRNWRKVLFDCRHYSLTEQVKLPRLIDAQVPDLVHFPHFNVPLFYRGRFVVTIHDLLMHKQHGLAATTLPPLFYYVKRAGYRRVFDHAIFAAAKIIVPTNSVKNELVKFYSLDPNKVDVTYEGFDERITDEENYGSVLKKYGIDGDYFIYAGNAYPHKNLRRAIEATIELNRTAKKKIYFVIVSARNVFVQRLERLVKSLNAGHLIKLLGFVSDADLGVLYKKSLAFIYPSLSEGFGLPGLEAMNIGTLVGASGIPVFREVYKDNAIYFNPFDFSAITKAMRNVTEITPEERARRIKKGKEFSKRYSWRKMVEETVKIYEDCACLRSGK